MTSTILGDWTTQYAAAKLDLAGYNLNFDDEFTTNTIGTSGASAASYNWFAPVHPTFGSATFVGPDAATPPFSVSSSGLNIAMQQVNGAWQTGYMQTMNSASQGYSQEYGYFEVKAKLPAGFGSWPGFELFSTNASATRVEIDYLEAYGTDPLHHHAAVHFTPLTGSTLSQRVADSMITKLDATLFDDQFHTYGVKVDPSWITVYMDRVELERFPANEYVAQPLMLAMDLAMNPNEVAKASGVYNMQIEYMRAYADPQYTALVLHGTAGADCLVGGGLNDTLNGSAGPDTLFGGDGDDSILGGSGFDRVNGNKGEDTIVGHSQTGDWLSGGQGNDLIDASVSTGANIVNGNLGDDTVIGGSGPDSLRGGQGDDVIHAGAGNAWLSGDLGNNTLSGGQGQDTFRGGPGHDVVNDWHAGDKVEVVSGLTWTASQVKGDVHISFSNGGEMDLIDVQLSTLPSGWIVSV
jgi:beta-glucanase (GH16 family)